MTIIYRDIFMSQYYEGLSKERVFTTRNDNNNMLRSQYISRHVQCSNGTLGDVAPILYLQSAPLRKSLELGGGAGAECFVLLK